jgi:hypothetical protein
MSNYTHQTAPTRFVEAKGVRYAYRRFGKPGAVPMLFLEYFNSNIDGCEPKFQRTPKKQRQGKIQTPLIQQIPNGTEFAVP